MSSLPMDMQVLEVANNIGSFIQYWGFKKIHGRIWALVYLSPEPVDANYLIDNLKVSKALVSMSLKDLVHYKVIMASEEKSATRTYIANPDIAEAITGVLRARESKILMRIKSAVELLNRLPDQIVSEWVDDDKLKSLASMVDAADSFLQTIIAVNLVALKAPQRDALEKGNK